jgi:hypothetical protein
MVCVGIMTIMKVVELFRNRVILAENRFSEIVLWRLIKPLPGSSHSFKYRLAYVVNEVCVLHYDNEPGKGDHRHWGEEESDYKFRSFDKLLADFQADIERWNYENGHS